MTPLTECDVIIVGAGISGLSAAHHLLAKEGSLRVLVIEATERVGGQSSSVYLKGSENQVQAFDMGAHFVSRKQPHVVQMVLSLDLEVEEQNRDGLIIGQNSSKEKFSGVELFEFLPKVSRLEFDNFIAKIEYLCLDISFNGTKYEVGYIYLDNSDLEEYLCGHMFTTAARETFRTIVRLTCGIRKITTIVFPISGLEPCEISVYFFLCFCNSTFGIRNLLSTKSGGAKEYFIRDGCEKIVRQISAKIGLHNIKLREEVMKLTQSTFFVRVDTNKRSYICSYVILALPLEDVSQIKYEPELNDEIKSLFEETTDACMLQFIATFEKPYWTDQGHSGEVFSLAGPAQYICDYSSDKGYALTGYVYNIEGIAVNDDIFEESSNIKRSVLNQLSFLFGPEMEKPLSFEYNNYPSAMPTGLGNSKALTSLTKLHGRILFGGAETATAWRQHVSGAIQSGLRCAVTAMQELRPQSLTVRDFTSVNPRVPPEDKLAKEVSTYFDLYGITGIVICASIILFVRKMLY